MRVPKLGLLIVLLASSCTSAPLKAAGTPDMTDPNIWLEDSKDPAVMKWVQDHNAVSVAALESDPRFQTISDETRAIVTAKDRIPYPSTHGKMVRNFWQDQNHLRGYVRQTTLADYLTAHPKWETILDIDELNKLEGKSWVYGGMSCLAPDDDICMMKLSDGGKDKAVYREFRVSTKSFVSGGFVVPEAKTSVSWIDKDTLFIGTDWGPDSLTNSGYTREVRIWKRGEALANAKLVFKGEKTDVSVNGYRTFRHDSTSMFIYRSITFYESIVYLFDGTKTTQIPFPSTSDFQGEFAGHVMAMLRHDWKTAKKTYAAGSVISIPKSAIGVADVELKIETIFEPDAQSAFAGFSRSRDYLTLSVLKDVRGELRTITRMKNKWVSKPMKLPSKGTLTVIDAGDEINDLFVTYQTYDVPTSLYYSAGDVSKPLKLVKQLPAKFDASSLVISQKFATSKDGTKVPYFLVHKKGIKLDGSNPTLLYGYGGFEVTLNPLYQAVIGKIWLEKGGVYAVANIRGGGEYGPRWHEAALKQNRQRAYDDFAAVARDLVSSKITSSHRLGIQGGSNGGLLVGVSFTQNPDLFNAVVCESALLDMIRYTKMPPGASWIGEYGDPGIAAEAAFISKYSPYQNVVSGVTYPEVLFHVSTADDRVHPGHSRKMTQRLEDKGHKVLFYENTEGGHGGAADPEQTVHKVAIEYTYLYKKLMD